MIWIALTLSIIVNIFFIWYLRNVLRDYFYVLDNLEDLFDVVDEFSTHLQGVHELETYYGDSTLQQLIKHSKVVVGEIEDYKNALTVAEEGDEEEEDGPET